VTAGYPREGETIGPFRVGRRLGGGGMGVVFEAHDVALDRAVALKVIAPELAEDADFRERFRREAQVQASLDSRHVVPVYGHGEDESRLWIATQLVPDGDLRTLLTAYGPPPATVAVDLVTQVAGGLADAHAAGLVHRDIKPANVLLRRRDDGGYTAYLADFGIARRLDADQTRTALATVGTPTYMAPELHTGGRPGVASDVYSLGCLLWATLTGSAPYAGTSDFEVVTAHRDHPVPQLADDTPLARGLNDVLRRTMAKDPRDRPASAAAVRDRLAALRGPQPEVAVRPAAPRSARRRRWPLLVGLATAVLVAAAAVTYAVTRDDGGAPTSRSSSPAAASPSPTASRDVETAVASMGAAFATQPGLDAESSACVARAVIDEVGLDHLVEIGMFDADLAFTDVDLADHPDVKAALSSATFSCLSP
jgi:serine/threonine protein kinase